MSAQKSAQGKSFLAGFLIGKLVAG